MDFVDSTKVTPVFMDGKVTLLLILFGNLTPVLVKSGKVTTVLLKSLVILLLLFCCHHCRCGLSYLQFIYSLNISFVLLRHLVAFPSY